MEFFIELCKSHRTCHFFFFLIFSFSPISSKIQRQDAVTTTPWTSKLSLFMQLFLVWGMPGYAPAPRNRRLDFETRSYIIPFEFFDADGMMSGLPWQLYMRCTIHPMAFQSLILSVPCISFFVSTILKTPKIGRCLRIISKSHGVTKYWWEPISDLPY